MNRLKAHGEVKNLDSTGDASVAIYDQDGHIVTSSDNAELDWAIYVAVYFDPIALGNKVQQAGTMMAGLAAVQYFLNNPEIVIEGDWLEELENEPGVIY